VKGKAFHPFLPPKLGAVCRLVIDSVCHSVSEQEYCNSNQPISLIFKVMTGPTSQKNLLTFGGDEFPDTDSGSNFHFPHHCGF